MKGYRTLLANLLVALPLVFDWLLTNGETIKVLFSDPKHAAIAVLAINVLNIVLRVITTTPVGKKEQ